MAGWSRAPHVFQLHNQAPPVLGRAPPFLGHATPPPAAAVPAFLHPSTDDSLLSRGPADEPLLLRRLPVLALEDRLASQTREIQGLLADNQRLAATHVALQQEVIAAEHEIRLAGTAASRALAERDAEVREVHQRSIVVEAKVGTIERMRSELAQVRADIEKLVDAKDDVVERLKSARAELVRVRAEQGQVTAILAEIESMNREIQKGRAAVEFEKKVHAENLQQAQIMQANMLSLAREVEKLRAELANAEKRARAAAAAAAANPGYAGTYGNSHMAYGGAPYAGAYSMHQVQTNAVSGAHFGAGAVSLGPYDIQQTQGQINPNAG